MVRRNLSISRIKRRHATNLTGPKQSSYPNLTACQLTDAHNVNIELRIKKQGNFQVLLSAPPGDGDYNNAYNISKEYFPLRSKTKMLLITTGESFITCR
jgi:hypothetical protein